MMFHCKFTVILKKGVIRIIIVLIACCSCEIDGSYVLFTGRLFEKFAYIS